VTSPSALEKAHHPGDLIEDRPLSGRGDERRDAAIGERVGSRTPGSSRPREVLEQPTRIGIDRADGLVDEIDGVPRNHGTPVNWARWVTSWSANQSRNCSGGKANSLLDGQHVRPDVVHDVLLERILLLHHQQVVADRARDRTSSRAPCRGSAPASREVMGAVTLDPTARRTSRSAGREALEARECWPDPSRTIGDPAPGRAGRMTGVRSPVRPSCSASAVSLVKSGPSES